MADADTVLTRLREDPQHLDALADLLLDLALDRPLDDVLDIDRITADLVTGLRATADAEGFGTWVVEQTRHRWGYEEAHPMTGLVGERIPVTALGPMETALRRPYTPDPALVRAVIDHDSLRNLMRDILQANLLEFGQKMRDTLTVPGTEKLPGRGFASRLAGVAKGVASAATAAVERQLEDRVKAFVDDALAVALDTTVERFSAAKHAEDIAQYRVDVFHALLQQPMETLVAERRKRTPEELGEDLSAVLKAFAGWTGLPDAVHEGLGVALGDRPAPTVRAWLEGSGLEAGWRPILHATLRRELDVLATSDRFAAWVAAVAAD